MTLPPSADPTLRDHLSQIRSRIFLPSHLKAHHRRLIYQRRHWDLLRTENITVDIGPETDIRLNPVDKTKDVPDSWKALLQVLSGLGDDVKSWKGVLVGVLEGFRVAGRRWKGWQWERIVREAGRRGAVGVVVEAARVGERTGLRLRDVRIVREVLWGCRGLAVRGKDEGGSRKEALRLAEEVAGMCEDKAHAGALGPEERDPKVQPDCIGILLELVVMAEKPDLVKVKRYAERLLVNLERGVGEGMDRTEQDLQKKWRIVPAVDYELMRWVPVWSGLSKARELLADDMALGDVADSKMKQLTKKVNDLKDGIDPSNDKGIDKRTGFKWAQSAN